VERIGVERSRDLLALADLVLYVVDGTDGLGAEDAAFLAAGAGAPVIPIWNKADRGASPEPAGFLRLSAATGEGIPELAARIVALLSGTGDAEREDGADNAAGGGPGDGAPTGESRKIRAGIASERQKALIDRALAAVDEALSLDERGRPLDLIARELREAVDALGEITGEVSTADILETMFGRFCVGK
jgi:tRNA modification GTPase